VIRTLLPHLVLIGYAQLIANPDVYIICVHKRFRRHMTLSEFIGTYKNSKTFLMIIASRKNSSWADIALNHTSVHISVRQSHHSLHEQEAES
jgi:hypothetical protein